MLCEHPCSTECPMHQEIFANFWLEAKQQHLGQVEVVMEPVAWTLLCMQSRVYRPKIKRILLPEVQCNAGVDVGRCIEDG